MIAQVLENVTSNAEQAEPIRVIRKVNGKFQWVTLKSEAEMTEAERRAAFVAMFL